MRLVGLLIALLGSTATPQAAHAQFGPPAPQNAIGGGPVQNGTGNAFANQNDNARGGSANADFDSLIDLVVSTVAPDTWQENGGGSGEIRPFPNGVWLDSRGEIEAKLANASQRASIAPVSLPPAAADGSARIASPLRFVSLPRLEAEITRRLAAGEKLDEEMLTLAGLRRVGRVFVVPRDGERAGDLILAGPAGDWRVDSERRLVADDTGMAVPRLDDLLTLLRREWSTEQQRVFGCSINPRQEALASTQRLLDETSKTPLRPGGRQEWLESIRSTLGPQDIEVFGIDPRTNAARVLVEADHHMKQVGLGMTKTDAVDSYMERVTTAMRQGASATPLSVLRWWFVADYDQITRSIDGAAYELIGDGVRVLSENQLLTRRGERVHTGMADEYTQGFADDFTKSFDALCRAYPVYSELRNVFDLAMVAGIIQAEGLTQTAGWQPMMFAAPDRLRTPVLKRPTQVATLATSRVVRRTQVLAAVSGGVWMDPAAAEGFAEAPTTEGTQAALRPAPNAGVWWWDAE